VGVVSLPTTIRLDEATIAEVAAEAERRGLSSASEYIRHAGITQLAWARALRAVSAGAKPEDLDAFGRLVERLRDIDH
jgi:hypothetical protein